MNAKERRKLLRQQQQQQPDATAVIQAKEEPVVKAEEAAPVEIKKAPVNKKEIKTESAADSAALNVKERHGLQRQATRSTSGENKGAAQTTKATAKADPSVDASTGVDASGLNSKQRRLLQRQAARSAEGGDKGTDKKPMTEPNSGKKRKLKASKNDELDEDGQPKKKVKSIHLTLFVGQLPYSATRETIKKHFHESGDIEVRMMTDKKTNKFKGTAFIEVKDSKALGAALSRHHTLFNGRRINVELTASGGGNKSEQRRTKIDLLRKKQSNVQIEKTKALVQKHVDNLACKLTQEDVDERMLDFLSWFDYETAKKSLEEFNRCVSDRVMNRKAFFMGILKRFRETDGVE